MIEISKVKLGDPTVSEIILGQSPPSDTYNTDKLGLPFYQGKSDFGLLNPKPRIWCSNPEKIALAGDILISVRAPVGDVNIAMDACAIGRGVSAIRAGKKIDNTYLFYALMFCKPILESQSSGAIFASINKNTIKELEIPYFPYSDQVKISKVLHLINSKILNEITALDVAQQLKSSAMHTLFSLGLRGEPQRDTEIGQVPGSWEVETIGTHHSVVSGGTPSRGNPKYWIGGTIPWVKTTEVNYCTIAKSEEHITQSGLDDSAAKMLPKGTILMAMYGQGVTRGKVAILGTEAACNQACAAINSTSDVIEARYLYHFLSYRYEAIRQLAHGGQQQNLNLDIVRDLPIAFPKNDKEEQNDIIAILDAIDQKINLHKRKRAVLEKLFKSLLHKLMTGEVRVSELNLSALDIELGSTQEETS
jgi:type I restriction enzyme S subunit